MGVGFCCRREKERNTRKRGKTRAAGKARGCQGRGRDEARAAGTSSASERQAAARAVVVVAILMGTPKAAAPLRIVRRDHELDIIARR